MAYLLSDSTSVGITLANTTDPQTILRVDNLVGDPLRFRFFDWGVNFQVESLLLSIDLQSLPTSDVPNIYVEDSEAIALKKRIQFEQNAAKIGIEFLLKNAGDTEWRRISRKNLLNHGRNYLEECLPQIGGYDGVKRLGKGSELAVQLINLGYGLLGDSDLLTIEATCAWSIEGFRKPDILGSPTSFGVDVQPSSPTLIVSANQERARLVVQNVSSYPVWLHFGDSSGAVPYRCLQIGSGGVAHELAENPSLLLNQAAWAIAEGGIARLVGIEVSFVF